MQDVLGVWRLLRKTWLARATAAVAMLAIAPLNAHASGERETLLLTGDLTDLANEDPYTGNADIRVRLFNSASGGTALWSECWENASIKSGKVSLALGSKTPFNGGLPGFLAANSSLHAELTICDAGTSCGASNASACDDPLSPRMAMGTTPYSAVAETVGGVPASQIIQQKDHVSQATLESLTSGADASALHHHDSLYAKLGSSSSQNFGSGGFSTSGSGLIGNFSGTSNAQLRIATSSPAQSTLILQGAPSQASSIFEIQNSSSSSLFRVDADGKVRTGDLVVQDGKMLRLGSLSSSSEGTLSSSLTASDAGKMWFNSSSGVIKYFNGSSIIPLSGGTSSGSTTSPAITGFTGDISSSSISSGTVSLTLSPAAVVNKVLGSFSSSSGTVTGSDSILSAIQKIDGNTSTRLPLSGGDLSGALNILPSTDVTALTLQANASQNQDLLVLKSSGGSTLSKFDKNGYLTLVGAPSGSAQAATKAYVDSAIAGVTAGSANFTSLHGDVVSTSTGSVTVQYLGGQPVANFVSALGTVSSAIGSATSTNVYGSLVKRGATGEAEFGQLNASKIGVGISNATPAYPLHVKGTYGQAYIEADPGNISWLGLGHGSNAYWTIVNNPGGGNYLSFNNLGNSQQMMLTQTGNVGIGTTSPLSKLTVGGVIESTTGGGFKFPDGTVQTTAAGASIWTNSSGNATLASGNVGIGTTSPTSQVDVVDSTSAPVAMSLKNSVGQLKVNLSSTASMISSTDSTAGGRDFAINSMGTAGTTMMLQGGGNVGIGTNAPQAKLHVGGGLLVDGTISSPAKNLGGSISSVDFSQGNVLYTTASCPNSGQWSLMNLQDGGSYTLIVQGATVGTCDFFASGFSIKYINGGPATTVAGTHSIFTFLRAGSYIYVSSRTGI